MINPSMLAALMPEAIRKRFDEDHDMMPRLLPSLSRFSAWFGNSGVPFFKTYTDHSIKHSLDVFRTGCDFLSDRACDVITSRDVCIFAASCFLNDAGMHITESQFSTLITIDTKPLSTLDTKSWKQTWQDFFLEAKRFNGRRLVKIFGKEWLVETPPEDIQFYTDMHRLLIGEFLRENHPRLAHDLALGMDTKLGLETLLPNFEDPEKDIAGLISRSHGCDVRSLFAYIERLYHIRDFNGVHIVFLMCLLGIADYAQIDSYRAPKQKLRIIQVGSPFSQTEWRVHQSIRNITPLHNDPESFYVDAIPTDIGEYLRLKEWLDGIQQALDKTWAILGEVYGRFTNEHLDRLSLKVRRIRSSIFENIRPLGFVPERIRFAVAEAEMLSLLLEPLYGDHPGYGARELIQNAVDAVREARSLKVSHLSPGLTEVSIELDISDAGSIFRVKDRGVGMTLSTIKQYFLNAGASFKTSSEWKKDFVDDHGKIEVVRSGRFGVGALAAFIIGPTIIVETRHYDEVDGWSFAAALHDDHIEIKQNQCEFGTQITVAVSHTKEQMLLQFLSNSIRFFQFHDIFPVVSIIQKGKMTSQLTLKEEPDPVYNTRSVNFELVTIFRAKRHYSGSNTADFVNGIAIAPFTNNRHANRVIKVGYFVSESFLCYQYHHENRPIEVSCRVVDRGSRVALNLARSEFTRHDDELTAVAADLAFEEILVSIPKLHNQGSISTTFFML